MKNSINRRNYIITLTKSVHSRKLQRSGNSTYIVSLPKTWIDEMRLQVGYSVTMTKNENRSLTIHPNGGDVNEEHVVTVTISPRDQDESICRKIVAMYLTGYKFIRIATKGIHIRPNQVNMIRRFVRSSLIGAEIVESGPEHITVQILTRLPDLTFDVALRRMRIMTVDILRESIVALKAGDIKYAEEVVRLDDEVDRFTFYTLRNLTMAVDNASTLHDMSLGSPANCMYYRTVVSRIERIADHATLTAKRVKYLSRPLNDDMLSKITELSDVVMDVFENSIDSLLRSDFAMAEDIFESVSRISRRQEGMMIEIRDTSPNSAIVKLILESMRRIVEYAADIAEIVIDKNIHRIVEHPHPRVV